MKQMRITGLEGGKLFDNIVTKAHGWAVATAGINSNVDVCEKAKHHTELFW